MAYKCKREVSCYFLILSVLNFHFRGGSFTGDRPDSSRPQTASSSRSDLVYLGRQQRSWNVDGYSSDNDVMPCFWRFDMRFCCYHPELFKKLTLKYLVYVQFRRRSIMTEWGPLSYEGVGHGTAHQQRAEARRTGTLDKVRPCCLALKNSSVRKIYCRKRA